jgi:hypothetical protein
MRSLLHKPCHWINFKVQMSYEFTSAHSAKSSKPRFILLDVLLACCFVVSDMLFVVYKVRWSYADERIVYCAIPFTILLVFYKLLSCLRGAATYGMVPWREI